MRYYVIFILFCLCGFSAIAADSIMQNLGVSSGFVEGHIESIASEQEFTKFTLKPKAWYGITTGTQGNLSVSIPKSFSFETEVGEHVFFFINQSSREFIVRDKEAIFAIKKAGGSEVLLSPYRTDLQLELERFYKQASKKIGERKISRIVSDNLFQAKRRFKQFQKKKRKPLSRSIASGNLNSSHEVVHIESQKISTIWLLALLCFFLLLGNILTRRIFK